MKSISRLSCALACVALLATFAIPTSTFAQKSPPQLDALKKPDGKSKPDYAEDEVLVRFKGRGFTRDGATRGPLAKYRARSLRRNGRFGVHRVKLPKGMSVAEAIARFSRDGAVESVQPNYSYEIAQIFPSDPRFDEQWALHNVGQTGGTPDADIDAPEAWDITTGSPDVVVALIDTGVEYTHPDLAANMWMNPGEIPGNGIDDDGNLKEDDVYGYDFVNEDSDPMDDNGHGTHCAGIIGAASNDQGVVGVNWQVKIMALKAFNANGHGYTFDAIDALGYVMDMKARGINVKITSNSWGGYGNDPNLYDAIQAAGEADILFVAAAGNNYQRDNDRKRFNPASYDLANIISVAATDHNDQLATFSNLGLRTVDLGAPGVAILSALLAGTHGLASGTSMATPHVAGVAALVYSIHPEYGFWDVKASVLESVDPIPGLDEITLTGGRLNARGAVESPPLFEPDIWFTTTEFNRISFPGETQIIAFTIVNRGSGALDIDISDDASWLEIDPAQTTIPGFDVTDVSLTIDTQGLEPGDYAANILIQSNDPDEGSISVPMNLTVAEDHVDLSVVLQGAARPVPDGWEVPLTISFFAPGSDVLYDVPIYESTKTASWSRGYATARIPYVPGTYDVAVDSEHTLLNVLRNGVISPANKEIAMGTLLEGDCDDDNVIGVYDYEILSYAYGKCEGDAGFDASADLDRDGCVGEDDWALLSANWNKFSPIEVAYEADVELSMLLQGSQRPDPVGWEVPVSIAFFEPGADALGDAPLYLFQATTAKVGSRAVAQVTGVQPGVYDVSVDSEHTLLNVMRSVVVSAPSTSLDMGTLLEGDCDDNHGIGGGDYLILVMAWGTCQGDANYDSRADLDRDGCVGIDDFGLLSANWGKYSPIEIPYQADVELSMVLQGDQRPDPAGWEVPVSVAFFEPGADVLGDTPQYSFEATTTRGGSYAVAQVTGVPPGVYDVSVDSEHTLLNVVRDVVISAPSTDVGMGTLLEGDCDDNHAIGVSDYAILSNAYGSCQGDANYDPRADLDRDGCVGEDDWALLSANWNKFSPIEVPAVEMVIGLQGSLRPDPEGFEIPVTIAFFAPGASDEDLRAGTGAIHAFGAVTTKSGGYAFVQATALPPGSYDITVDSEHTLMNVKRNVEIAVPGTEVLMGALLEGDCDDDHWIGAGDYLILSNAYGGCEGDANYDPRADLDRDGCVGEDDWALLSANWGKSSPIDVP